MPTLLALVLLLPLQEIRSEVETDMIQLVGGRVLTGQVVFADDQRVVLRNKSVAETFPAADVEQIDSRARSLLLLLDELTAAGPRVLEDNARLRELADYADHSRLPGEAALLRTLALLNDPLDTTTAEALGATLRSGRWHVPFGRKTQRLDELAAGELRWKDRVQIDTAHYRMRTNLPLEQAALAALDLERTYRAFFDVFGRELALFEPREIMEVDLHADERSFPQPGSGRSGSFTPEDRVARALTRLHPWRYQVVHEAVRQLFFYTTRRETNAKGIAPRWVTAGAAEALATGLGGKLGFTTFDMAAVDRARFRIHARFESPYGVSRTIVLTQLDFEGHQDQDVKYAQCYTLIHFLLYGGDEERRTAFFDYLREAYQGKAGPTFLRKRLGDLERFDADWLAYVKDKAGV